MIPELYDSNCFNLREPVVKNSSSRRRSARILKSKSKKETDVEQIDEQEEGIFHKHLWYLLYKHSNIETNEDAEVEQEESVEEDKAEEEVEVAKDESKSTESVQVLSTKTAITSHIHTIVSILYTQIAQVCIHYLYYYFSYSSLW